MAAVFHSDPGQAKSHEHGILKLILHQTFTANNRRPVILHCPPPPNANESRKEGRPNSRPLSLVFGFFGGKFYPNNTGSDGGYVVFCQAIEPNRKFVDILPEPVGLEIGTGKT